MISYGNEETNKPYFRCISRAFAGDFVAVAEEPQNPEFVYVPFQRKPWTDEGAKLEVFLQNWNWLWEAAQHRIGLLESEIPAELSWLKKHGGNNFYLLPEAQGAATYGAYLPLFHLLPTETLIRFGLKPTGLLGTFPMNIFIHPSSVDQSQIGARLQRAFAYHIWTHMDPGATLTAYSPADPIVVLSHNLNFWLPYAYRVIEQEARGRDETRYLCVSPWNKPK